MAGQATALEEGRAAYAGARWSDAYQRLVEADAETPLGADDLELLARSAYMLGEDDIYVAALERAYRLHFEAGRTGAAVGCTWWIGHNHLFHGRPAHADGWFATGNRLAGSTAENFVERGYLLCPIWLRQMSAGEWEAGHATAVEAEAIGERFGDADLTWLARDEQCRALVRLGRLGEALRLAGEVLVVAESGALSPVVSGIVFCNTIGFLHEAHQLREAREWTDALSRWCEGRPQMVAHLGFCLVHRAEILQMHGELRDALAEARDAAERFNSGALNQIAVGRACYRQAEVHRLQGRLLEAGEYYGRASDHGWEPVPGLAQLRLAQGDIGAAAAMIRRAATERVEPVHRATILPAYIDIMLADEDLDAARLACDQLDEIVAGLDSESLRASADFARGCVAQAEGDYPTALAAARRAWLGCLELDFPYEAARARLLLAQACQGAGDEESARLEARAAHDVFASLGATRDVAMANGLLAREPDSALSRRELEVLRLVASGRTNKEIGDTLVISQHTVARHLQNIYLKIGVSSRAAAAVFASDHDLR
jgi:DNA-binding CsgD family transcriptional regulator